MKIFAVMIPKGGSGKTTTADSIGYILGEEQCKKVLMIEGDEQGDTSRTFGCYEPEGIGTSELIEKHISVGGEYRTTDLIRPTPYPHIDIIPGNGYLRNTDIRLSKDRTEDQIHRIRNALEEVKDAYDYCICDCGRLVDMVVLNMIMAAGLIIVPVKVGGFEIEALQNLNEQVEELRLINQNLRLKGLMVMRQKNKTSLDTEEWLKTSSGHDMFITPVRRTIVAERASMAQMPLPLFSRRCIAAQDYRNVAFELIKEMGDKRNYQVEDRRRKNGI